MNNHLLKESTDSSFQCEQNTCALAIIIGNLKHTKSGLGWSGFRAKITNKYVHKNQCNSIPHFVVFMFLLLFFPGQEVKGVNFLKHPYLSPGETQSWLCLRSPMSLHPCSGMGPGHVTDTNTALLRTDQ